MSDPMPELPATLDTLDHLPEQFHEQYGKGFDGRFSLKWIPSSDRVNLARHMALIAKGQLEVFPEGETPTTRAAIAAQVKASNDAYSGELARLEREQQDARIAQFQAAETKRRAEFDAEQERMRRSYRR